MAALDPTSWLQRYEKHVQALISHQVQACKAKNVLAGLTDSIDRAYFAGGQNAYTGAWVNASASYTWSRMHNEAFRSSARTRLGAHELADGEDRCGCTTKNNSAFAPHLFICSSRKASWTWRHNLIRDTLIQGLKKISNRVHLGKEPLVRNHWNPSPGTPADVQDRADIFFDATQVSNALHPSPLLVDVVVSAPRSAVVHASSPVGTTAIHAALEKVRHYSRRFTVPKDALVPFALEPSGVMSSGALNFLLSAARLKARPSSYEYAAFLHELHTRVSLALQIGNTSVIRRTGSWGVQS